METLSQAVSIKSVSADPDLRNEVVKMMKWAEVKLQGLGATTELCDIGFQVKLLIYFNYFDKNCLRYSCKYSNQLFLDIEWKNCTSTPCFTWLIG